MCRFVRIIIAWAVVLAPIAASHGQEAADKAKPESSLEDELLNDFRRRDGNGDGQLSLEELLAPEPEKGRPKSRQLFIVLDFDGSKSLSWDEFRTAPGKLPIDKRGAVPDPIADLKQAALEKWQVLAAAADKNDDGALNALEWPAKKLAKALPDLADVTFALCDRDKNGAVDEAEMRWMLDLAYGFTRPDGRPLRTPTGGVLDWSYMRYLDADHDGFLSLDEFVSRYWMGKEKSAEAHAKHDADHDGRLAMDEAEPLFWDDTLTTFCGMDANLDGLVNNDELMKSVASWGGPLAPRTMRAFDENGDGKLSLREYRMTTFANRFADWGRRRADMDNDGRLSWKEYGIEAPPLFVGLNRHFFEHFDLDNDGFLSLGELDFDVDFTKIEPEVAFRIRDTDHDGKLVLVEVFMDKKPEGDPASIERYEARLAEARERFVKSDRGGDGALDLVEFGDWQRALVEALKREAAEIARRQAAEQFAKLNKDSDGTLTLEEYSAGAEGDALLQKRAQFFHWDVDENQRLSLDEFARGGQGLPPSPLNDFRGRDANGDGQLSADEVQAFGSEQSRRQAKRELIVLDFDRSGSLSWDEFRSLPGRSPVDKRPAVPDPIADLRQAAFEKWQSLVTAADKNGDRALTKREWPAIKMADANPALADVTFSMFDRDSNGQIDEAEAGRLFDLAYGFTRPSERPLRLPTGLALDWSYMRYLDTDHDGFISLDEFAPRYGMGKEKSTELLLKHDTDRDKRLSAEEAEPIFWDDALNTFRGMDSDLDGLVSNSEFLKSVQSWGGSLAPRTVRAFDENGDGKLSFYEYRMTTFANRFADWGRRRSDLDNDGRLSWKEYNNEALPLFVGLNRHFFEHFDLDKNGFLSLNELEFDVDFTKIQPEVAFRIEDADGDGKLVFAEVFAEKKPDGDPAMLERYERRVADAHQRFAKSDRDGNGSLDLAELGGWRQAQLEAAQREAEEVARQQAAEHFGKLNKDSNGELTLKEYLAGATDDERLQKRAQFFSWDADENGSLSLDEFAKRGQGLPLSPLNDFRGRDANGDGQLSADETQAFGSEQSRGQAKRELIVLDFDRNESLSWDEFRALPGRAPVDKRPAIPDPIADLREAALEKWQSLVAAADGDGDRSLTQKEWPAKKIAAAIPALADVTFAMCDRDDNGRIDEAESRALFDLAYGLTRPGDRPLRKPTGKVLDWSYMRYLDVNHDSSISLDEFVPRFWMGKEKNAELLAKHDADHDGRLAVEEAEPIFWDDTLATFCGIDADLDGLLSNSEFLKSVQSWGGILAPRTVRAFDKDGDGKLSFYEYRMTTFANRFADWGRRATDADNDGRLSWKEYNVEAPPVFVGLSRHFFEHFDLDKDGFLSLGEFEFEVDLTKAPPEISFRAKDIDGDGKLVLAEVFAEKKPADGDARALDRYEMRLAHAENRFLSDDKDGSGYLDLQELIESQQSAMQAARRHSKVLSNRKTTLEGNYWVRKGVLVVNEIAFIAGVIYVLRRRRPGDR